MGDRIIVRIKGHDGWSPDFYGHWCGYRAIKVLNDLVRTGEYNNMAGLFCNFIVEIMERKPQKYSYYVYGHDEVEGAADWDNYTWSFDLVTQTWTTTDPQYKGETLSMVQADEIVRNNRPELYKVKTEEGAKA